MRFGRKAYISATSIRDVLDSLVFSTTTNSSLKHLKHLFFVEKAILDPNTPESDDNVLYILQSAVVDIIIHRLMDIRSHFQIESAVSESLAEAAQSLITDAQTQSSDLLAWSVLYYVYVQPDLGFTVDSIGDIVGVTSRTIRRYRKRGIELLTKLVWQREEQCRRDFHHKTLVHKIGAMTGNYLGRAQEIETVKQRILDSPNQVIYVHGESGIGKTAFVKECIVALLGKLEIDEVLWLPQVTNAQTGISEIKTHFSISESNISLEAFLSLFHCIFVFDDADDLLKSSDIDLLLHQVAGSTVFVTSTTYHVFSSATCHISMPPLSSNDIIKLANDLAETDASSVSTFVSEAAGNPGKLHDLVKYYGLSESIASSSGNLSALKLKQRLLLAFVPHPSGISVPDFEAIVNIIDMYTNDVQLLFSFNILSIADGRVYGHYEFEPTIFIDALSRHINSFIDQFETLDETSLIVRHILNLDISFDTKLALVRRYWRDGVEFGDKLSWHSLLTTLRLVTTETWLTVAIGVSHKRINQLQHAQTVLTTAIEVSGSKGEFELQTEAMLELIKVYRQRGQYKNALYLLDKLDLLSQTYLPPQLLNSFILEKAQLALDQNQVNYALSLANASQEYRSLILQAECFYRLDKYTECLDVCDRVLTESNLPDSVVGTIHNLIGRCYQPTNIESSAEHYSLAIEYFRQSFSLLHLSRAQVNLATTFIMLDEFEKANEYFDMAQEICTKIADVVGLKTIEKNRAYIHHLILSRYK